MTVQRPSQRRGIAPIIASSLVILWVLVACTDRSDGAPTASTFADLGTPDTSLTADPYAPGTTSNRIMALNAVCTVPDPAIDKSFSPREFSIRPLVTEIHAGLTKIVEGTETTAEPYLAETMVVRDGGRTYEFRLRQNLKFSDGSHLTARDFKWSWERAVRLSVEGGLAQAIFGNVVGASEIINGDASELSGVDAVDDRTLTISLTAPATHFPMLLALPTASVLKESNVSSWPLRWDNRATVDLLWPRYDELYYARSGYSDFSNDNLPVGAGPFKLSSYKFFNLNAPCAIVRNDHFHGARPNLDAVVISMDPDSVSWVDQGSRVDSYDFFRSGMIDYMLVPSSEEYAPDVHELVDYTSARVETVTYSPFTMFLAFDSSTPPFDDVHFRRALVHISDMDEVFELPVNWQPLLIPPRLSPNALSATPLSQDTQLAHDEISKSQYSEDIAEFELTYFYDEIDIHIDRMRRLFKIWEDEFGLRTEVILAISDEDAESHARSNPNRIPIRRVNLRPAYPDPYSVFSLFQQSGDGQASDNELDAMLFKARTEADRAVRREMMAQAEQHMLDHALVLPLLVDWEDVPLVVQPWVHNFKWKRFTSSVFHDIWFDDTAPERRIP